MTDLTVAKAEALIDQLMALHPSGYDFSLERIERLLSELGDPHKHMPPIIHVAGTNGKGSFTAFARALLEADGHVVHVHTSPHLVRWHERFRIGAKGGGQLVSDAMLYDALARVAHVNHGADITVFELLTAAMFLLFSEQPADVAIIETGLGGRLDSTNVIERPAVSAIMSISMDHMSFLGETPDKIASEKAGIVKQSCPVTISNQIYDEARDVLVQRAEELSCPLSIYGQDFVSFSEHGRLVFQDEDGLLDLPLPNLEGTHQLDNAATAIRAVRDAGFRVTQESAAIAMRSVSWPGRFQPLPEGKLNFTELGFQQRPDVYLDGGHNQDAARVLVNIINQMPEREHRPLYLIAGMLTTKEPKGYFETFRGLVTSVMVVPLQSTQSDIPTDSLTATIHDLGIDAQPASDLREAFEQIARDVAQKSVKNKPMILLCGSLYLIGDILAQNDTLPE